MGNGSNTATLNGFTLQDILNAQEIFLIQNPESASAREFVSQALTSEERMLIDTGSEDEIILAIIANMMMKDVKRFEDINDNYFPKAEWQPDYIVSQRPWLEAYEFFENEEYSVQEYMDNQRHHERWRVFYILKHPERIKQERDCDSCLRRKRNEEDE